MKFAEKLNLVIKYLPPYRPNLNPIERLWKVMTKRVRNNLFFKSAKDFKYKMDEFLKTPLPKIGTSIEQRINDYFQQL